MRIRRILWSVFFLSLAVMSSAQQPISKMDYEDLVDNMICDFTTLSLKEQPKQPHFADFQKQIVDASKCDYYGIRPFLRDRTPIPSSTLQIVNLLNDKYKSAYAPNSTNKQLYQALMNVFEEEEVKSFAANHSASYGGFKSDMDGFIREVLNLNYEDSDSVTYADEADLEKAVDGERTPTEPKATIESDKPAPKSNQFLFWGLLILLIAILIYFGYDFWKRNNTQNTNNNVAASTPSASGPSYQEQIDELKETVTQHKSKLTNLLEEIELLHERLNKVTNVSTEQISNLKKVKNDDEIEEISALDAPVIENADEDDVEIVAEADESVEEVVENTADEVETPTEDEETPTEEPVEDLIPDDIPDLTNVSFNIRPETFFMPIPNEDSTFDDKNWKPSFEATESVYKFEKISADGAQFTVYQDEDTVRRALNGFDVYLKPACKGLNEFNINATKIVTHVPGKALKEGKVWKVVEKALIAYE